jgi:hypothetical protein
VLVADALEGLLALGPDRRVEAAAEWLAAPGRPTVFAMNESSFSKVQPPIFPSGFPISHHRGGVTPHAFCMTEPTLSPLTGEASSVVELGVEDESLHQPRLLPAGPAR